MANEWNNEQTVRLYLVSHGENHQLFGVFSNRKKLMEALNYHGLEGCYIKGAQKNKEVNSSTISVEHVYYNRICDIHNKEGTIEYRVHQFYVNCMAPAFLPGGKENTRQ